MAKGEAVHSGKMCAMTCCRCNMDLGKVKAVVKNAKYVCQSCGHVAAKASHLCEPAPLK